MIRLLFYLVVSVGRGEEEDERRLPYKRAPARKRIHRSYTFADQSITGSWVSTFEHPPPHKAQLVMRTEIALLFSFSFFLFLQISCTET